MYDLVIVGAGPAGSTAAYVATKLGLKTLVIDRLQPPREKPCGGGLTPRTWRLLNRLGLEFPTYGGCRVIETRAAGYRFTLEKEPILVTRRPHFDYALFKQSGADFVRDQVLTVKSGVVVGRLGEYGGRIILGADGATSAVAKSIGVYRLDYKSHAMAYMTIAEGPPSDTCVVDIDSVLREVGKPGYAWIFPLDGGANVGVGAGLGRWIDLRNFVRKYAEDAGYRVGQMWGHPISLGHVRSLGRGNVLLAGEAAGLVDATTGEGIYYAIASGAAAAVATYVGLKVYGSERRVLPVYTQLVKPYVEEVKKTRLILQMAKYIAARPAVAKLLGKRLIKLYSSVYTGEATYSLLLKPVSQF